jgi:peptidoglycan LD-endopeptidase LytH
MSRFIHKMMRRKWILVLMSVALAGIVSGIYLLYRAYFSYTSRNRAVFEFLRNPSAHHEAVIPALIRCGEAPFIMPTSGMIGFLWGDSFRPGHRHQGIDIFGGTAAGDTPVYAAYDGFLSRLPNWTSTVIIRIPSDPLQPERQIWTYYTHMADQNGRSLIVDAFPPGSTEIEVLAGTLLGYQGNYSGTVGKPTGVHLHFSIVKDDGQGRFMNELKIENTLDPAPYFGLRLNAGKNEADIPVCESE